ncbi:hypothetical protein ACH5RR_024843 [Cinchona calisaya]|uniref:Uncharacterized protein n=1 Tax=Cinchona calisaya TaxID=153742 RepID=A0ABD2YZY7_9GENT
MRCLRLQLLVQVSGSILGIDYDMEDEDGGEARKKKEVGSDVEFREIDARGFGVLLFLTCLLNTLIADEMDVNNRGVCSLASSALYVIMRLDHFRNEPIQILAINGSWLLPVFSTSRCILLPGFNFIIAERTNQIYGQLLERCTCFRFLMPAISGEKLKFTAIEDVFNGGGFSLFLVTQQLSLYAGF